MSSSSQLRPVALCLVVLLAGLLAGCSEGTDPRCCDPPPDQLTTPDAVIAVLVAAYERRAIETYDRVLDEGFTFQFAPGDMEQLEQGVSWDRAAEMSSAARMFSGQPGTRPDGSPIEPIQSFLLRLSAESAAWDSATTASFPGTIHRTYGAEMIVYFQGGGTLEIRGTQDFYLVAVQVEGQTQYRIRHWVDLCMPPPGAEKPQPPGDEPSINAKEPVCWSALRSGEI